MSEPGGHIADVQALLRVLEVSRQLSVPADLPSVLRTVIEAGRTLLGADRGSVFLYAPETRELYSVAATGEVALRFPSDKGIAGHCATTRATVNVPDCYADPRFNPELDRKTGYRTRCLISVPLIGLEGELVGVMQLLNPPKPAFDAADQHLAQTLAGQAAAALQRAQLIAAREVKMRLEHDLAVAKRIQEHVLPKSLPQIQGYEVAAFSRPADETGGDVYDLVPLSPEPTDPDHAPPSPDSGRLVVLLGDATGHGIGPALTVTQLRGMLRMGLRLTDDIGLLLTHIDRQLSDDLPMGRFITAFLGLLCPRSHRLTYHSAGQAPILWHRHRTDGGELVWFDATGLPLGLGELHAKSDPPMTIDLAPGDAVVLASDGFYEAPDPQARQLGRDGVGRAVLACDGLGPQAVIDAILHATAVHVATAPQADDMTLVVIRRLP